MDRKPASRPGQFVPIVRKLWISSTLDFQRALHLPHIRLLVKRFNSADVAPFRRTHGISRTENSSALGQVSKRGESSRVSFVKQKMPILRRNWTVACCNLQILKYLRLVGGQSRERTILHRRIVVTRVGNGANACYTGNLHCLQIGFLFPMPSAELKYKHFWLRSRDHSPSCHNRHYASHFG